MDNGISFPKNRRDKEKGKLGRLKRCGLHITTSLMFFFSVLRWGEMMVIEVFAFIARKLEF